MANYNDLLTAWMRLAKRKGSKNYKKTIPALTDLLAENDSSLFTRAVETELKKNSNLENKLAEVFSSDDQHFLQQRSNALRFLSTREKDYIIKKLSDSAHIRLKVYLIPATFISETKSLSTIDAEVSYSYALISFITKAGGIFFSLLIDEIKNISLDFLESPDLETDLAKIHKNLGVWLLAILLAVDPNILLLRKSWGYTLQLDSIYTFFEKNIATYLSVLKRYPFSLLPQYKKPHPHEKSNAKYKHQTGIFSHSPGRGIRIKNISSSYFSLINSMQTVPHRINPYVIAALQPFLDHKSEKIVTEDIWKLFWPPLKPRVIMVNKWVLNKLNRWKLIKQRRFSKTQFYNYENFLPKLILTTALIFSNSGKPFYLPYFSDPRGRIYSRVILSAYQGDLSRGLLSMGNHSGFFPTPAYLGKCMLYARRFFPTLRKCSRLTIISHMIEHVDHTVLQNELDSYQWVKKKNPCQYLAWLLEMKRVKEAFDSKEPTVEAECLGFFDMIASGLQILTCLTAADPQKAPDYKDTLNQMNFIIENLNSHGLNDIYSYLIEEFLSYYNNLENHSLELRLYLKFLKLAGEEFRRKISKTFIMKLLYAATMYRSTKDNLELIKSKLTELKENIDQNLSETIDELNRVDYKVLFKTTRVFLVDFKHYLRSVKLKSIYSFIDTLTDLWDRVITYKTSKKELLYLREDKYIENYFDYRVPEKIRTQISMKYHGVKKVVTLILKKPLEESSLRIQKLRFALLANMIQTIDSELLRAVVTLSAYDKSAYRAVIYDVLHDCISGHLAAGAQFNSYYLSAFKLFFLVQKSKSCKEDYLDEGELPVIDLQILFKGFFGSYFEYLISNTLALSHVEKADFTFLDFYFSGRKKNS